jgi:hypothetical protein
MVLKAPLEKSTEGVVVIYRSISVNGSSRSTASVIGDSFSVESITVVGGGEKYSEQHMPQSVSGMWYHVL